VEVIEYGDKVLVYWEHLREVLGPYTVLHTPVDTGDMWRFEARCGRIYYVNPNASRFEMIELVEKGK
jgi:hypothetical protein